MNCRWPTIVVLIASTLPANAGPKGTGTGAAKVSLPSKFFVVTRECKQLVSEVGSSNESPQRDLVGVTPAQGYISLCTRVAPDPYIARCISRVKDKDSTFISSGSRDVESLFIVVVNKPPLVLMQDETGENAMYINTESEDVVVTSRQYFGMPGGLLGANNKFCKAMIVSEADMEKLSKTK
jgi:hypothetical protein